MELLRSRIDLYVAVQNYVFKYVPNRKTSIVGAEWGQISIKQKIGYRVYPVTY